MTLIRINRNPTRAELRWFGVLTGAFLVFFGGLLSWWSGGSRTPLVVLAAAGVLFASVYHGVRPLQRPLYLGWMHAVYPLGWVVSHVILGLLYFAVLTPIGLVMRVLRRDALQLPFDRSARSYWTPRKRATSDRYFRQF